MFIPVSLATGPAHVDITIDIGGSFRAACPFLYDGQGYEANSEIQVERTKTVRLTTTITGYREISVVLAGKQYYWHVDLPKALRYVDDDAYKRVTGTIRGKLLNTNTRAEISYVPTPNFTGGDTVASIDFVKKEVWFFNTASEVKRLTVTQTPVAVVFLPRWSTVDSTTTVCYIVTTSTVIRLDDDYNVEATFNVAEGVVAASGDTRGMLVLAYENRLVQWRDDQIEATIIQPNLLGIHSIFVAPDNTYVLGCNAGIMFVWKSESEWLSDTITPYTGLYWAFDITATDLYAVDAFNRCLVRIDLAERVYHAVYYDKVPRDVTVTDDGDVYVSFLNDSTAFKYNAGLTTRTTIPALKSFGAAYLRDYWVTDLYSNALDVTKAEPAVTTDIKSLDNLAREEEHVHRWTVDWERPEFVRLGTTNAMVRVNGNVFTQGYLRRGDSVAINMPPTSNYYDDRYVTLVGRRSVVFGFRTVPKLFPDYVVADQVASAFLRVDYEEMFEVTGMTWGFDVGISLTSKDVKFAVNDGPFGLTGRIQNGDIVHLTGTIQTLVAQRTAHKIVTQFGEPVAEWTLLPMLLDGSTKHTASTVKKDRYAHLFEANSTASSAGAEPIQQPSTTSLSSETYAESGSTTSFGTVTVNGACAPSLPCYTIDDLSFIAQPSLLTATASNTVGVLNDPSVYKFDSQAVLGTRPTTYTLTSELLVGGILQSHTESFQSFVALRTSGTQDSFDSSVIPVSLNTTYGIDADYYMRAFQVYYTPMDFIYRPLGDVTYMDAVYAPVALHTTVANATNYINHTVIAAHEVDTEYDIAYVSERPDVGMEHFKFVAYHKEEFTTNVDAFWTYPVSEFSLASERRAQMHRHEIDTSMHRRPLASYLEFESDPTIRSLGVFVPIDASYALRPNTDSFAVHSVYVRKPNSRHSSVQTTAVRRSVNSRLVNAPQVVFVHSSRNEHTLSPEQSGFGTREQAELYAESINVADTAIYMLINERWIFTTRPNANSAACGIITVPPSVQRRYGYVGGG